MSETPPAPPHTEADGEELLKEVLEGLLGAENTQQSLGEEGASLSDDCMLALHSIFQQNLVLALDLVDRGGVTRYSSTAAGGGVARLLYVVQGSAGSRYVCLSSSRYCSCPAFVYSVLVRGDALLCKHQLAVQLAVAMGRCEQVEVSGEEWAILASMDTKVE